MEKHPERYLVFGGFDEENRGGWNDFISDAPDLDIAREIILSQGKQCWLGYDWFQIVDLWTLKIIE